MIVTQCLQKLKASGVPMKIVAYIDQVYLCQKKEFISVVNQNADFALAFTPYWETIMKEQGVSLPSDYLQHGFNPQTYYPIPKEIARKYYGLSMNDFIILNLNRNQPRKRWDTCLKAFAEVVSRYPDEPIKMMIATAVQGGWNLIDIFERELKKRNVSLDVGMKHLIIIDNPQRITDEETNILYNVADIGINTCDGEGFGLCNFEQAAIGIPQIVPNLGGFLDFFDDDSAYLVEPSLAYYVDSTRDMVAGEALMSDYMDFVDGILCYYQSPEILRRHGDNARKNILEKYAWKDITKKLVDVIERIIPGSIKQNQEANIVAEVNELKRDIEEIDITQVDAKIEASPSFVSEKENIIKDSTILDGTGDDKKENKKLKHSLKELKKLKQQIEQVLTDLADEIEE
jgi:glycosyltransferase involved in cell wall biosynthesis